MLDKEILNNISKDRLLIALLLVSTVCALILIVSGLVQIRPSDVQVPVRYSAYGVTNLYREKWYYLISFIGAGLLLLVLHPLVILKMYKEKGREFAVGFAALTVLTGLIGVLLTSAVFRVVSISL
ncbi:hypothetical protein CYG49_03710 [Candidatus Saccharibacteria bacterium]|nr:MAG: hypothetical protein CYG49_03710 [Candidatus Saccharibacteria bacterium]